MNETYQEIKENEISEPVDVGFATIGEVFGDGATLIFDGEKTASQKHYKCNTFAVFKAGQRVKISKDSGTYVVEYPIGAPKTSFNADTATLATTANTATTATSAGRTTTVVNQYSSSTSYDIQLRTNGISPTSAFQIRLGNSGTWKTITVT